MIERKTAIIFVIIGIGSVLGFISGVAPGIFLKSYALFGIGLGLLLFIVVLWIIIILIFEYQNKHQIFLTSSIHTNVFNKSALVFTVGTLFGVLCELLLKAISVSLLVHLIIAAIFILVLLILFVIILILELKNSRKSKIDNSEQYPVLVESNTRSQLVIKPHDGQKNTAARINHYRSRYFDDDSKSSWQNSDFNNSMIYSTDTFNISKPLSTIQREYQKLLRPSPRFYVNEKVYVNDNNIAQIIGADGLGNYKIQYLDNGLIDFKNGAELRKALPLIS